MFGSFITGFDNSRAPVEPAERSFAGYNDMFLTGRILTQLIDRARREAFSASPSPSLRMGNRRAGPRTQWKSSGRLSGINANRSATFSVVTGRLTGCEIEASKLDDTCFFVEMEVNGRMGIGKPIGRYRNCCEIKWSDETRNFQSGHSTGSVSINWIMENRINRHTKIGRAHV